MYIRLNFEKYKDIVKIERKEYHGTSYLVTYIPKYINQQDRVFPRVRMLSDSSLFDYMWKDEVLFAINAGIFNTSTGIAECLLISNGKIIKDENETYIHTRPEDGGEKREELYILGITMNGNLKVYPPSVSAYDILEDGCMDAVMGFVPLIMDGTEVNYDAVCSYISIGQNPRQIICQCDNDDFLIITAEKPGLSLQEVRHILKQHPIKTAYNLDGGKSTQTVYYKDCLIPVYAGETGRHIPSIITFEIITGEFALS